MVIVFVEDLVEVAILIVHLDCGGLGLHVLILVVAILSAAQGHEIAGHRGFK